MKQLDKEEDITDDGNDHSKHESQNNACVPGARESRVEPDPRHPPLQYAGLEGFGNRGPSIGGAPKKERKIENAVSIRTP